MLHHLAGATIQIANFVNYNCHSLEDGKNKCTFTSKEVEVELPPLSGVKLHLISYHNNLGKYFCGDHY